MGEGDGSPAYRRFRAHRGGRIGAAIVAVVVGVALAAPLVAPHAPDQPFMAQAFDALDVPIGSTREFPLGADALGRCELSRLLFGARISLAVAFAATALAVVVGTLVGGVAGYFGGKIDTVLMRFVDALLSFPFLLVVMAINKAVARPGIGITFLALGLFAWTGMSRQVRAKVMQTKELEFVAAARALGASVPRILWSHILPSALPLVIVLASLAAADVLVAESALSFLGVGVVAPTSSWGSMLRDAEPLMATAPALSFIPGAAILVTVVGFNLLGEGLRDAFDPGA